MKSLVYIWIILLCCCMVISCKDSEYLSSANALQSAKTEAIKRGEPVLFTFKADSLGHKIDWQVSPAQKVKIQNSGTKARITFQNAGNYTVLATNSVTTQRVSVTVDSSIYVPSDTSVTDTSTYIPPVIDSVRTDTTTYMDTINVRPENPDSVWVVTKFNEADEIIIAAEIFDSIPNPSILLTASTVKTYKCPRTAIFSYDKSSEGVIRIEYSSVSEEFNCTAGNYHAKSWQYKFVITKKTTPIELLFNGVTYRGTITTDGSSFTIDWPDSKNIKFSKTYIKN